MIIIVLKKKSFPFSKVFFPAHFVSFVQLITHITNDKQLSEKKAQNLFIKRTTNVICTHIKSKQHPTFNALPNSSECISCAICIVFF